LQTGAEELLVAAAVFGIIAAALIGVGSRKTVAEPSLDWCLEGTLSV
jgi:hypothetical protein